jgi:HSP20 family protein
VGVLNAHQPNHHVNFTKGETIMTLLRWDPFADMTHLREQVNRLFEQSMPQTGRESTSAQTWSPAVDIFETSDAIGLRVDVAGIAPDDIDIQMAGDTLTIKGERKLEKKAQGTQYIRLERTYGAFQRSFTLGVAVNEAGVRATYRDGVLEITLPKKDDVKPKQVKIEVGSQEEPKEIEG